MLSKLQFNNLKTFLYDNPETIWDNCMQNNFKYPVCFIFVFMLQNKEFSMFLLLFCSSVDIFVTLLLFWDKPLIWTSRLITFYFRKTLTIYCHSFRLIYVGVYSPGKAEIGSVSPVVIFWFSDNISRLNNKMFPEQVFK